MKIYIDYVDSFRESSQDLIKDLDKYGNLSDWIFEISENGTYYRPKYCSVILDLLGFKSSFLILKDDILNEKRLQALLAAIRTIDEEHKLVFNDDMLIYANLKTKSLIIYPFGED